ncbi:MAG: AmmeMemoRadiSam system protein A [Clostridia bacterium]|nr:AmmeMemoRadiSam system protein A [Clostridia bacterium]
MGKIISSYVFPHPPIIIPEVGKGNEDGADETIKAVVKAAKKISMEKPTTIIVTTPHGPVFQDYVYVSAGEELQGSLERFGAGDVKLRFDNNIDLVNKIISNAKQHGIFAGGLEDGILKKYGLSSELDHGTIVPLYFVNKKYNGFKLVHISISGLPFLDLYKFGMCISKAVRDSNEQVVFLASGDLSHKLSEDAPYGFNEKGRIFDELLVESMKRSDVEALLDIDEDLCESAGECGLRSFIIMFGALDGYELKPQVYSYEGPFGVGYSVVAFDIGDKSEEREILRKVTDKYDNKIKEIRAKEDAYVSLARRALEEFITKGEVLKATEDLPAEMLENKAGTFVSIKKHGQLRGCIGTTGPTRKSIAEEIIHNAVNSGMHDPRFDLVESDELGDLVYSVDILKDPEPITSMDELDVIRYGVIVRAGSRSGLLLPNLEGVDTPQKQVSIALQKAGIKETDSYKMERFEVVRHK